MVQTKNKIKKEPLKIRNLENIEEKKSFAEYLLIIGAAIMIVAIIIIAVSTLNTNNKQEPTTQGITIYHDTSETKAQTTPPQTIETKQQITGKETTTGSEQKLIDSLAGMVPLVIIITTIGMLLQAILRIRF